jgi:Glycine-rich domain-containing protein-like
VTTEQSTRVAGAGLDGVPSQIESLDGAWAHIEAIDLSNVRRKLANPRWGRPLPGKVLDHAIRDYRRFLYLMRKHPGRPFSPTLDIDLVWHEHILDTVPYWSDSAAVFGRYLHHMPGKPGAGDAGPPLREGMENTRSLYLQEFGEELETYFGNDGAAGEAH